MNRSRKPAPRSHGGHRRRGAPPRRPAGRPPGAGDSRESDAGMILDRPVAHVAFRGGRCETFLNSAGLVLRQGDYVLTEAERGQDLGRVVVASGPDFKRRKRQVVRELVRQALPEEVTRLGTLIQQDREALEICQSRAQHFNLEMKVIGAETQFDGNRITFYFTAEQRVDFRELVRDLAGIFRTRIELRQVGARDAARRCDGVGPCGRRLCCTTFLREFEPVTLKMAKDQSLPLNPAKISGSCGRLMCCLNYEAAGYQAALRSAPAPRTRWRFAGGEWSVERLDLGNYRVVLLDEAGARESVDLERFQSEAEPLGESAGAPESPPQTRRSAAEPEPSGPDRADRPDD